MTGKGMLDKEIAKILELETAREQNTIDLIAAENYASKAVLQLQGSILTNKYTYGYPAGNGSVRPYTDAIETLAIERARKLFKAEHANVQPHSGSQANMAVYIALLEPGDTVMGMTLSHGGHLTHGAPANFSGKFFNFTYYGLNRDTEMLDYDEVEALAFEHKPKMIIAGSSSYPRLIDFERFRQIADKVNAYLMVDIAHIAGMVAVDLHPSPVPYAHVVTSSSHKTIRGPRSGFILCKKELASKIDTAVMPMMQGGPLIHAIAAKARAFFEAMQPEFYDYQKAILENAKVLAEELQKAGFKLVSGGTDNHIVLVDLTKTSITGIVAQLALEASGIVANRNAIPFDPFPPKIAGGMRFGSPAVTSRGFGPQEMRQVAAFVIKVLSDPDNKKLQAEVKKEVEALCRRFPAPGIE
jgi:glycine hydroxymethyltransferase